MQVPFVWHWLFTHEVPEGHCAPVVQAMPVMLQALQVPVQVLLQQTPSTQFWLLQSLLVAHFVPLASEPEHTLVVRPVQLKPNLQKVLSTHVVQQAPAPLQVEVPHSVSGSVLLAYGEQVPTLPGSAQDWHVPLHAALQHTPSTHWPDAHSAPAAQDSPLAFFETQAPPLQKVPPAQSAEVAHEPRHTAVPLQR